MTNEEFNESLDTDKVVITLSEYEHLLDCKKELLETRRKNNESVRND